MANELDRFFPEQLFPNNDYYLHSGVMRNFHECQGCPAPLALAGIKKILGGNKKNERVFLLTDMSCSFDRRYFSPKHVIKYDTLYKTSRPLCLGLENPTPK